ncbi:MAG: ATP synthase F1 subunit gamma [Bacilli bacterium]|nr:ATP synthase F1 subunit gamma [Bacilli bacterium]
MAQEVARIKKRIKSVGGSYKITSAMKLVSTVKLKKWKNKMLANKEYALRIDEIAKTVFVNIEESSNPYFEKKNADKNLYIVLSSSLGLCGAYNSNIFRLADVSISEKDDAIILGKKAISHYQNGVFNKIETFKEYSGVSNVNTINAIVDYIKKEYLKGTYKEIHLIYTAYKNSLVFHPVDYQVLPLTMEKQEKAPYPPIMEPNQEALIEVLIPLYLKNSIYAKFLESEVCEQAARSNAMENATKNAEELLENLQIEFNKARQAAITQEITEIVGASQN